MDAPVDALATILSGGATGILGTAISRVADYVSDRQKNNFQLQMSKTHVESIDKEFEGRVKELEVIHKIKAEIPKSSEELSAANTQFNESLKETNKRLSEAKSKWFIAVDVVRATIRPLLTVMLCVMCFVIWAYTEDLELRKQVVLTILYMATTAALWWFGTRPSNEK